MVSNVKTETAKKSCKELLKSVPALITDERKREKLANGSTDK